MFNAIVEALVERASFDLIWPICRMHSQVSYQRFHLQWGICCWMLFCKFDKIQSIRNKTVSIILIYSHYMGHSILRHTLLTTFFSCLSDGRECDVTVLFSVVPSDFTSWQRVWCNSESCRHISTELLVCILWSNKEPTCFITGRSSIILSSSEDER